MTRKTTIYLPDELKAGVEREAARRGVAEAVVIRDAITSALAHPAPTAGLFSAEPFAARTDELLDGFGARVIVADTSGLLALFNSAEPAHEAVATLVADPADRLVVSPFVVAELDYLVATRIGIDAELAVLAELAGGAFDIAAMDAGDLAQAAAVVARYRDQAIGVADASIVVLADRYATRTVLTLDHRHFDVLRPLSGGRFRVVPQARP